MAKYSKSSREKVDPAKDWKPCRVRVIDHWTVVAWESNGLGEIRQISGGRPLRDREADEHFSAQYDAMRAPWKAEREQRIEQAEAAISRLRRKYLAQGRVLHHGDLSRELSLEAKMADVGKRIPDEPARRRIPEPVDESPIIRVDDVDRDEPDEDVPRCANEDDNQGEGEAGEAPRQWEDPA